MEYSDKSIRIYLKDLASRRPVPGGGSSAAIMGALGCGLISMVAHFTLSDKGINGYKNRTRRVLKKSEFLCEKLTLLIDKDIRAYEKLSKAFKKQNSIAMGLQSALKGAIITPCRICDYSHQAAGLALEISYVGKKSILSDVIVAIHALDAAFESGFVNIKVNIKYLKDKAYAVEKNRKYMSLQRDMKNLKTQILSKAGERMNV
jgi:methenyltetrahydrofolate cyclohydrolase